MVNILSFLCGLAGKESACNAGDLGSIPGLRRSPREGKGYPLQYSGLENSMDYTVHGVAKSQTLLSDFHFTSLNILWKDITEILGVRSASGNIQVIDWKPLAGERNPPHHETLDSAPPSRVMKKSHHSTSENLFISTPHNTRLSIAL